jgi:hypothetical protein
MLANASPGLRRAGPLLVGDPSYSSEAPSPPTDGLDRRLAAVGRGGRDRLTRFLFLCLSRQYDGLIDFSTEQLWDEALYTHPFLLRLDDRTLALVWEEAWLRATIRVHNRGQSANVALPIPELVEAECYFGPGFRAVLEHVVSGLALGRYAAPTEARPHRSMLPTPASLSQLTECKIAGPPPPPPFVGGLPPSVNPFSLPTSMRFNWHGPTARRGRPRSSKPIAAVRLRDLGLRYSEIAHRLNITVGTSRKYVCLIRRARSLAPKPPRRRAIAGELVAPPEEVPT